MFRRTKTETPAQTAANGAGTETGKGRPTPTRKEAEAAAKARAQAAKDPRSSRKVARTRERDTRMSSSREIREGIKRGDEKYLGRRDQGPMRRFVRDFVDTRLNIAEFSIPLLFASLVASAAGQPMMGNAIMQVTILLVVVDSSWLVWRLKRQLKARFPGESTKGTTFYALSRALQLRFLRIPKSQVKLGQQLPDNYR